MIDLGCKKNSEKKLGLTVLPSKVGNVISMGFKLVSIASLYGLFMIKILGMPIIINQPPVGIYRAYHNVVS